METRPRVLVVGMGALGRIYAAALATRLDVRGLVRTAEQAEKLSAGFRVRKAGAERRARLLCHPREDDGWRGEIAIVLTKSMNTADAVAVAAPLLADDAPVLTIQNGLGNREAIAARVGEARSGWGVSYVAGTAIDGTISELVNPGETVFGRPETGADRLDAMAGALAEAGLPARISAEAGRLIWVKVVMAGAMNATGALSGLEVGDYWADPQWRRFLSGMVQEGARVARAVGMAVPAHTVLEWVEDIARRAPQTTPSMLQDVRRRRPTEVEAMIGELVRRGGQHGIEVPTLREAVDRIRRLEASW